MKLTILLATALLGACASAPAPALMAGEEPGRSPKANDPLEAVRPLRRAALAKDGAACLDWLARVGASDVTLCQRMDARLSIAALLLRGSLRDREGRELTSELHYQLAWSWATAEPRSAARAADHDAAYRRAGGTAKTPFSEAPAPEARAAAPLSGLQEEEGTVWGGGHDRLFLATGLLAFLTDEHGGPVFRGTHLRLRNAGRETLFVTARSAGQYHRELAPGAEFLCRVEPSSAGSLRFVTGVDVKVHSAQASASLASGR
jgi:hypothetical protein